MEPCKLGFGPMSRESIRALATYSKTHDVPLMVIASRNQVDCAEVGGGYVGDFTTQTFADYVRSLGAPRLQLCRDHSGPYLHKDDAGLSLDEAMARTVESLKADIDAGFDLLHIDASACGIDEKRVAAHLFESAIDYAGDRPVEFEYGSEDNVGIAASVKTFKRDVEFALRYVKPRFVVGQTGSLVRSVHQRGKFAPDRVRDLVRVAEEHGVGLKEHNADYLTKDEIAQRWELGVAALNIAPELGVRQTQTVRSLAIKHGLLRDWNDFGDAVIASGRANKWRAENKSDHVLAGGHYLYTSNAYQTLIGDLAKECEVDDEIQKALLAVIARYH